MGIMAGLGVHDRVALLRNSRFRLLFVATFASGIGTWLAVIALTVDVYDRTHSGWWVGELLVANILPAVFIGLLFGPLVDRLSRKWLMIASDLGRLAVFAVLPFANSAGAIVVLAVIAGIGNAFFRPAVLAGLPNLVAEERALDRRMRCSRSSTGRRRRSGRCSAAPSSPISGPEPRLCRERRDLRDLGGARRR